MSPEQIDRNMWLKSPEEMLQEWRAFRIQFAEDFPECTVDALKQAVQWWYHIPRVGLAMDPYSNENPPTLWEIIDQKETCKYSHALALAYTISLISDDITVARIRDTKHDDEYMIAIWNNEFVLNSLHGDVVPLSEMLPHMTINEIIDFNKIG